MTTQLHRKRHQWPQLVERREQPAKSKLDRIIDGILASAGDLESDVFGVDVRPLIAERLRRIASELENLSSRDLLRVAEIRGAGATPCVVPLEQPPASRREPSPAPRWPDLPVVSS